MQYVRDTYNMPWLKRGLRVRAGWGKGTVTSASHYVHVRMDATKQVSRWHPTDVQPLQAPSQYHAEEKP